MSAKVGKDMLLHRLTILRILREQTKLRWRFAISTHHPRGNRHYIQGSIARDKSASAMSHDIRHTVACECKAFYVPTAIGFRMPSCWVAATGQTEKFIERPR